MAFNGVSKVGWKITFTSIFLSSKPRCSNNYTSFLKERALNHYFHSNEQTMGIVIRICNYILESQYFHNSISDLFSMGWPTFTRQKLDTILSQQEKLEHGYWHLWGSIKRDHFNIPGFPTTIVFALESQDTEIIYSFICDSIFWNFISDTSG